MFPLHFVDMLGRFDVEASIEGGGHSSQAGALRLAISRALLSFVSNGVVENMRQGEGETHTHTTHKSCSFLFSYSLSFRHVCENFVFLTISFRILKNKICNFFCFVLVLSNFWCLQVSLFIDRTCGIFLARVWSLACVLFSKILESIVYWVFYQLPTTQKTVFDSQILKKRYQGCCMTLHAPLYTDKQMHPRIVGVKFHRLTWKPSSQGWFSSNLPSGG